MADKNLDSIINIEFTEPSVRTNIESGEEIKTLFGKVRKWFSTLKNVAFTGSYTDLADKPAIPSKVSQLANDSGFTSDSALNTHKSDKSNPHGVGADQVKFTDGETFQQKLDSGKLKGDAGAQGIQGIKGDKGDTGATGTAATITVGTVTTGAAGTSAGVTNAGTTSAAKFNFTIPQGAKGDKGDTGATGTAATITVGTVTTGAAGTSAGVTNAGTTSAAKFNFTIPQGAKGDKGDKGDTGAQGVQGIKGDKGDTGATGTAATITVGTVTTGAAGTSAGVTNVGTTSAAKFNFTIPQGAKGDKGDKGDTGASGATASVATTTSNGLMSSADKTKLEGISAGANNYTHPTTAGYKHIPAGGSSGKILKWNADGTAAWGDEATGNPSLETISDVNNVNLLTNIYKTVAETLNLPIGNSTGYLQVYRSSEVNVTQVWIRYRDNQIFTRNYNTLEPAGWKAWTQIATDASGNAATATALKQGEADRIKLDSISEDTGWVSMTLLNGFTIYSENNTYTPKVRRIGKTVHITGAVSPPSNNTLGTASPTNICAIPAGFTPNIVQYGICQGTGRAVWLLSAGGGYLRAERYRDETGYVTPSSPVWMPFNITYMVN